MLRKFLPLLALPAAWLVLVGGLGAADADLDALLGAIKSVGAEGKGNAEAGKAWRRLVEAGPDALPKILTAFDGADAAAANWLRGAVDAVAERELKAGRPLPQD